MKKILLGVVLSVLLVANNALAMNFSAPEKIGEIGFPVQAPYHGFIVDGATSNDGKAFTEEFERDGVPIKTFVKGTAHFGELSCKYDFDADSGNAMHFGIANNFFLTMDGSYKKIFFIGNDAGLKLYAIYHSYCTTDLKIIGKRGILIDSKKISEKYFGGKDGYKIDGSVLYDVPTCAGNTIVVTYRRWHWQGESAPEGELRFKWNDATKNFDVEQKIY